MALDNQSCTDRASLLLDLLWRWGSAKNKKDFTLYESNLITGLDLLLQYLVSLLSSRETGTICSLSNWFDLITEHVGTFFFFFLGASIRDYVYMQPDKNQKQIGLKMPKWWGLSGNYKETRHFPAFQSAQWLQSQSLATCRRSQSVHDWLHTSAQSWQISWRLISLQKQARTVGDAGEERGPVSQLLQERGHQRPRGPKEVIFSVSLRF